MGKKNRKRNKKNKGGGGGGQSRPQTIKAPQPPSLPWCIQSARMCTLIGSPTPAEAERAQRDWNSLVRLKGRSKQNMADLRRVSPLITAAARGNAPWVK